MRRVAMIFCCLAIGVLAASPGSALDWEVRSYVFANEKPTGPNSSYVWGRGVHQLVVSHVKLIDTVIPFRFKISSGQLKWESEEMDACAKPWTWSWQEVYFQECRTSAIQAFCDDGSWTASVTGKLDLHPAGGTRFSISPPNLLHCACT